MTKLINLTQGKVSLVDDDDFDRLNKHKWFYHHNGYAARNSAHFYGKRHMIQMHREIIKTPIGMETDHINQNGLDNRKENLRICTTAENQKNIKTKSNNTSGFKGVNFNKQCQGWIARITMNRQQHYLGAFSTPEEAAHAYDAAARLYHGEFAALNFPKERK